MKEVSEKNLEISIVDLKNLSPNECSDVTTLFIFDPEKIAISPDVTNDNVIERAAIYNTGLYGIEKFKRLKNLYFVNIYMTDIPESVLSLEKLEELQFNFLNQFVIEKKVSKLIKFKNLKSLMLNQYFIGDDKFNLLKAKLSKTKIKVISS